MVSQPATWRLSGQATPRPRCPSPSVKMAQKGLAKRPRKDGDALSKALGVSGVSDFGVLQIWGEFYGFLHSSIPHPKTLSLRCLGLGVMWTLAFR